MSIAEPITLLNKKKMVPSNCMCVAVVAVSSVAPRASLELQDVFSLIIPPLPGTSQPYIIVKRCTHEFISLIKV